MAQRSNQLLLLLAFIAIPLEIYFALTSNNYVSEIASLLFILLCVLNTVPIALIFTKVNHKVITSVFCNILFDGRSNQYVPEL